MREASGIWWKEIAGPKSFVSDVTAYLLDTSVIVRVPDDLPWRHEMRQEIQDELRESYDYSEISIQFIDAEDVLDSQQDISAYILDRFALDEVKRQYRKKTGKSLLQFIVEKNILQDDVLWIKGISKKTAKKWLDFFYEFKECEPKSGRVVLELLDNIDLHPEPEVREIRYSSYVSDYNLQLFCSLLLDSTSEISENKKRYAAALAAHLCDTDAEIAECFLSEYVSENAEPTTILKEIAKDTEYARRGAGTGSGHILALVRENKQDLINKRIWEAQLQVLFPIVEADRVTLIHRIEPELRALLNAKSVRQFDEIIDNPYDVEWGTLAHEMYQHSINDEYYLKSLTSADRDKIKRYRQYRNNLAHSDCCTLKQVEEILMDPWPATSPAKA